MQQTAKNYISGESILFSLSNKWFDLVKLYR